MKTKVINAKYVVLKTGLAGEQIIIFSKGVEHRHFQHMGVVSAGFIKYDEEDGWLTFGKSESLGVDSREEDIELVGYLNIDF